MPSTSNDDLLEILLDSWDRNNKILINLLRALPAGGLEARAMPSSPSVAQMFNHIHYVRLIFITDEVPEFATPLPSRDWSDDTDPARIATELDQSAQAVHNAVKSCVEHGQAMKRNYDHPVFFLQHMMSHEGYHHGQIKLALKINGLGFADKEIGPLTWGILRNKTGARS